MTNTKFCKDCSHHNQGQCTHANARDLVTAEPQSAALMRGVDGLCEVSAHWFKAKE